MRIAIATSTAALLASLVALTLVFTRGARDDDDAFPEEGRALAAPGGEHGDSASLDAALTRRVEALEREVRVLRREVQILSEDGPTGAGRVIDAQGLALEPLAPEEEPLVVEQKLAELVKKELQAEEARRWASRRERMVERNREQVTVLKEEHDVDDATATKIEEMLAAEQEQLTALFQSARESGLGRRDMRTKVREIRVETDDNVRALLNEEQALAWETQRLEERGWGRPEGGAGNSAPRRDDE